MLNVMVERALQGHHALITGGGTGIGAAAAEQLTPAGAKLSLLGRRLEPLAGGRRANSAVRRSNATSPIARADRNALSTKRAPANGPIDLLIVNAGIAESAPFPR